MLAGSMADATPLAERALELSRTRGHPGGEARALWILGEIVGRVEPPDVVGAEGRYRDALTISNRMGARPLQAHCHLGLGKLYRRVGRVDGARAALATAVEMFREMGMTHWLPEAEAELVQST